MKKLLIFCFLITAFSCSKEKMQLNTSNFLSYYPDWVNSAEDVYIFISSKLGSEILKQPNFKEASIKANILENEAGLKKIDYYTSILENFNISENELIDYNNLLLSSDKFFNEEYLLILESRFNSLVESENIESLIDFKNNYNRCSLGEAIWSVVSGTGTLIACGGAVVTCVPTGGVTCVGCAISAAGTVQAMRCWFN